MRKERVVVKSKDEVTDKDVWGGVTPEERQRWKQYVVIDGNFVYGTYDDSREAYKVAKLLSKKNEILDDIADAIESKFNELTPEELKFFKKYTGELLELHITWLHARERKPRVVFEL